MMYELIDLPRPHHLYEIFQNHSARLFSFVKIEKLLHTIQMFNKFTQHRPNQVIFLLKLFSMKSCVAATSEMFLLQ